MWVPWLQYKEEAVDLSSCLPLRWTLGEFIIKYTHTHTHTIHRETRPGVCRESQTAPAGKTTFFKIKEIHGEQMGSEVVSDLAPTLQFLWPTVGSHMGHNIQSSHTHMELHTKYGQIHTNRDILKMVYYWQTYCCFKMKQEVEKRWTWGVVIRIIHPNDVTWIFMYF